MSANSRRDRTTDVLARFSVLVADATLLINRDTRPDQMIESLLSSLQLFKENRLGGIKPGGVVSAREDLLNMRIADFFTIERFKAAGLPHRYYRTQVLNRFTNEGNYSHQRINEYPQTVQDLLNLGRGGLRGWKNIGHKTIDVMYQIFKHEKLC